MATRNEQKLMLENKIYSIMKSILSEGEKKEKKSEKGASIKRKSVLKWLKSNQEKHSVLAYDLWNKKQSTQSEKDAARSLFSKKFRGQDTYGKPYSFTDDEINTLFNMKDRYIDKIS